MPLKKDSFIEYQGKSFVYNPKGTTTKYLAIFNSLLEEDNELYCELKLANVGIIKDKATNRLLKQIKSRSQFL
jgi:hypothetical protein